MNKTAKTSTKKSPKKASPAPPAPVQRVADACRTVVRSLDGAFETPRRSGLIDFNDLRETLLAIADELDPPVSDLVAEPDGCPDCGERHEDRLHWQPDGALRCDACGTVYRLDE